MLRNEKIANDRAQAAQNVQKLRAIRWSDFKNGFFTARGLTSKLCLVLVNALVFQYVFACLPNLMFTGNFYQAIETALLLLVMTGISKTVIKIIYEWALVPLVKLQSSVVALITFLLLFIALLIMPALMLEALTVVPGYLVIDGPSAMLFAMVTLGTAAALKGFVFGWFWPSR